MEASRKMRQVITALAEKYGLDLTAEEATLQLEMKGFDQLVIEKVADNLLRVAYSGEPGVEGVVSNPAILFYTEGVEWIPITLMQTVEDYDVQTVVLSDYTVKPVTLAAQVDLANFIETWAQKIQEQGWLENASKWDPCDPRKSRAPNVETLLQWEAEGGCEAIDGCWVETDGTCPHGCPSWLIVLGLI